MTQEKYYLTAKKICMHAYSIPFYSVQPFQYRPVQGENIIKIIHSGLVQSNKIILGPGFLSEFHNFYVFPCKYRGSPHSLVPSLMLSHILDVISFLQKKPNICFQQIDLIYKFHHSNLSVLMV